MVPSLLAFCIDAVAESLPLTQAPTPDALPDEDLVARIYEAYIRVDQARRHFNPYNPARHLAALRQFAGLWQPSVLLVTAPCMAGQPGVALCAELAAFSNSLSHLELTSATATWLSGLQGLHSLTCLSLRHCPNLTAAAIQAALQQLPQLTSLDLSGLAAVSDVLAPTLVSLRHLVVLQLNHTACSDTTVEYLTYGQRLHQWSEQQHQQVHHRAPGVAGAPLGAASPPLSDSVQQWPRTKIRSWHLAYTRVTPRAVELLASCSDVVLLDLRGSGVRAAQLAPLQSRFALSAVQGAVLSRTAALVLAAVTLGQFVCTDAAQHGAAVAAISMTAAASTGQHGGPEAVRPQQWVNQGVQALLQAAAEVAAAGPDPIHISLHDGWVRY